MLTDEQVKLFEDFVNSMSGALFELADAAEVCIRSNGIVDDVLEEAIASARKVLI